MKKINLGTAQKIHFIGIGGISMSGLAEVLLRDGYTVTGSDDVKSRITDHLQQVGIRIAIPNCEKNITADIDLVVYTAAVKPDNPEFATAASLGIKMMERAALLGVILQKYDHAICIAGTHGKTTSTSLMAEVAMDAGLDPTISIGGYLGRDGTNYRVGDSSYFVLESCEYNNSYHHWYPHAAIILNIDNDHEDFFGGLSGVIASFKRFAQNIHPGGLLVIQHGTPGFQEVIDGLACEVVTFGLTQDALYWAANINFDQLGHPTFNVMHGHDFIVQVGLPLPGQYNMLNALAVFATAHKLGIAPQVIAASLSNAKGVQRRFEYKGEYNGARVIDDYAHHPTEIISCLQAARKSASGKLYCLFQPHTYTRTKNLFNEFCEAFTDADVIVLLPIYAAREAFDPNISSLHLAEGIKRFGGNVLHINNFDEACKFLQANLSPGDMLITMGAGDVYFVGEAVVST